MRNEESTTKTLILTKDPHLVNCLVAEYPNAVIAVSNQIDDVVEWFFIPKY